MGMGRWGRLCGRGERQEVLVWFVHGALGPGVLVTFIVSESAGSRFLGRVDVWIRLRICWRCVDTERGLVPRLRDCLRGRAIGLNMYMLVHCMSCATFFRSTIPNRPRHFSHFFD